MRNYLIIALFTVILPAYPVNADKITFDDLYSFERVSDPQFSTNGTRIAFVVSTTDIESGGSSSHVWIINSDGSGLRQLTHGPTDEWHPRWSPDNKYIAFDSDRDGDTQIWLLPLEGEEAKRLTSLPTGVSDFEWAPSGDKLIFPSRVYPDCRSDSCNAARLEREESHPIKARLYDRLLFRHSKSWDDGRISRLFITDTSLESHYQLTSGQHDAPTAVLGGYVDYAFSGDGAEVCYVMNTDTVPALSTNNDLFIVPSAGGTPVRITLNKGQDMSPQYSPDGRYISYFSQARAGYESDQNELMLYDRKTGEHTNLTSHFDRSIGYYCWGLKSTFIYLLAIHHGLTKLWRLSIPAQKIECLLSDAVCGDLDVSPDGKTLVVSRSISNQPYELYLYDIRSEKLKRLTFFTKELVSRVEMQRAEEFWFEGFNGDSVHGWLTLPPGFDSTRKYPLVLLIHGGPQWCWLGDFNYYGWNTQLTAAEGYVVAQIDPHGSIGYGIEFKEYVSGNWGKGDFEDLMKGVDYLINHYRFIDSTRMAALGRSYGGFMVNWMCGHTDRFKCLISIDGIFSQMSSYYSTDELWFPEWEFKGTPWTNREEYIRASPSTYVENFKTPMMITHGQKDYRVDVSEAFQMFTALQRMGVPSQLLYYPDEGHSIRKLNNLRHVYEKQFEWLARWLRHDSSG